MELGSLFHQPPWVFENAPFHWYRVLRKWFIWRQRRLAQERKDAGLPVGWDAEQFSDS